ncbi:hypothetical protein IAG41_17715 [Sphingomonas sp. JC676]|uniref:hypothetical protein n=1 Tax=Sphingomonas sp. JC676 TaxID=2768065 RepID=UPI0016583131|nr:hypothetical protein [Sphingomonas sp. JC676]MBC9034230.1 hypothetical protein [Sphingomonas sp. JC676]
MLLALVLQATAPQTAVDAERAFNAAAQAKGQWTAFREFAAPDAIIFDPEPVKAAESLPDRDPPIAVQWWPAESYVSCDGMVAVNTGPWVRPRSFGYFTTVWEKRNGAWRWTLDAGDVTSAPRPLPERPHIHRASCKPPRIPVDVWVDPAVHQGRAPDSSLRWAWKVDPNGSRWFQAMLWNGRHWQLVVDDKVAAPK